MNELKYSDYVDLDQLDDFGRLAQKAAASTDRNIDRFGLWVDPASRGESTLRVVSRFENAPVQLEAIDSTPEGVGTKNQVADAMRLVTGKTYYDQIAQDTIAMIVNDLPALGSLPVITSMICSAGSSEWFQDEVRNHDLLWGWANACNIAGCVYGNGESEVLEGQIYPDRAVLVGFTWGTPLTGPGLTAEIEAGDAILILASSGIHANGLSAARALAKQLPAGYETEISDGRLYGEALLDPTLIYIPVIEAWLKAGLRLRYGINITGSGWSKLMRLKHDFTYVIDRIPPVPPVLQFICDRGQVGLFEAYKTYNMGGGYAAIVHRDDLPEACAYALSLGYDPLEAGYVDSGPRRVVLDPVKVEYKSLGVR